MGKVEFLAIPQVLTELERLSQKMDKTGKYAALALNLIKEKCKVLEFNASKGASVDDALMEASIKFNVAVATLDLRLKRKLREVGRPIITLRGNRIYYEPEFL